MPTFKPADPDYHQRVERSFSRQQAMQTLGIKIVHIEADRIELMFDYQPKLTQQHGYIHAGIITTAMDNACGYAAYSLMPADAAVLTVEFKSNFLAPAQGERFRACGQVIKPGKTITVCQGEAFAEPGNKLIATMTCTLMVLQNRGIDG